MMHQVEYWASWTHASRRLARWRLRLSEFEYEVRYRLSVRQNVAYAMSRLNANALEDPLVCDDIQCFTI